MKVSEGSSNEGTAIARGILTDIPHIEADWAENMLQSGAFDKAERPHVLSLTNATLCVIKIASLELNTISRGLALASGVVTKDAIIPAAASMCPSIGPILTPTARPPSYSHC